MGCREVASGTFSTDGFGWLGLNPAGVSLFRMHVELGASKVNPSEAEAVSPWPSTAWFSLVFLAISPLPVRWCHFNNFDAACQVLSGSCVGLSSSFFRASESNVRHFFEGWFWLVGLESCWGFPVSDACWTVPLGKQRCTVEVHLSLGHQKAALESFWALLAGLGSCPGGVWLCRMGCREVGFWCGGAFCTVEFHLSLRGFGWFGLVSMWCLVVSHGLPRGRFLVWRCVLHGRGSSFFRPSESSVREFFGAAVLAGLGSFLGGVWLFRICCGEVGFWCGGAFCTVEFHLSLGHQKVALESFLALRVWLVGLESCWGFPVSDACWTVPLGASKANPSEAVHGRPLPGFLGCLTISPLPVRWCPFNNSTATHSHNLFSLGSAAWAVALQSGSAVLRRRPSHLWL